MQKNLITWTAAIVLMLLAALPRFYELGSLGFYGDEETTALAARSVAEGGSAAMPSGMPYQRALPQIYLNAGAARLFGLDKELSYRVPAAVLGAVTVPVLFLLARFWVGTPPALLAAVLLAFSEWHIATSREARMYAPFLLFYTVALFSFWRWAIRGGWLRLITAAASFLAATSFHILAMVGVVLALVPLAFGGRMSKPVGALLGLAIAVGGMSWVYHKWTNAPLSAWNALSAQGTAVTEHFSDTSGYALLSSLLLDFAEPLTAITMAAGVLVGVLIARRAAVQDAAPGAQLRVIARYVIAAIAAGFTMTGRLHGAALAWCLFLAIYPYGLIEFLRTGKALWAVLFTFALVSMATVIAQLGVVAGLKKLFMFPFPYDAWFLQMLGGVFFLFAATTFHALARVEDEQGRTRRAFVLAVVLPFLGAGIVSQWGGTRYLIEVYPFVLLLAAVGLLGALEWVGRRTGAWGPRGALVAGIVLVLSGALGGHGLPQAVCAATVQHGDKVDKLVYDIVIYPDHASPGRFVARHLRPQDLVVAEDVLEQYWYAGRVDYGLRDPQRYRPFLYKATDGRFRDIYVNSISLDSGEFQRLQGELERRIWVITSGETYHERERHLSPAQAAWLQDLTRTRKPVFVGRDSLTKVYCLNCDGNF